MRTQVGIVGAGPAGLVLAELLGAQGIESVVVENRARDYVQQRVRAGVLEQGTVDLLIEMGAGERLEREGIVHRGLELRFEGRGHRIALSDLTGGRGITIYGQQEVVKDLIDARRAAGVPPLFEVSGVSVSLAEQPSIRFTHDGAEQELECDFIAGCDGFHGICRPSIPDGVLTTYEHEYPFAWLGILARVAPSTEELIYCSHERGFALHSLRSPELSRLYLQCDPGDDIGEWPDERIWEELQTRFAVAEGDWTLKEGPIAEKGITPMRSFVVEPMQHGKLFLAGDAAHIVPPTGAKGLNLAVADVKVLAEALAWWYRTGDSTLLASYSETCLRRVWRVQHFSWWMTSMLHRVAGAGSFERRLQLAQLDYVCSSRAGAETLAENYVGL
ncbi:MAG: p-hydroxybenzoate 3-monooxygenase [Thermoleophilaceae bacterium]|jgi:p-hydroxybenzoate 3-monooxygenase|nr:p-hydroxybenzoate 3-monooxygenase [Thermoleophilaceae bacterium]